MGNALLGGSFVPAKKGSEVGKTKVGKDSNRILILVLIDRNLLALDKTLQRSFFMFTDASRREEFSLATSLIVQRFPACGNHQQLAGG